MVINKCVTAVKVSNFSGHYLCNRSTLDIGVLGYISIVQHKEHSPEVLSIPPGTPCIYSILLFVTKHKDQFLSNSPVHKINTRQTCDLYIPAVNLAIYQKGVYYSGIKIYNHLPTAIKDLSGVKNKFKLALKRYVLHNSFYSLEEYFNT